MIARLSIILCMLAMIGISFFLPVFHLQYLIVLSAVQSLISGYLAIRNASGEPRYTKRDSQLVKGFRQLIASDAKVAILVLQLAVLTQAIAAFQPPDKPAAQTSPAAPKPAPPNPPLAKPKAAHSSTQGLSYKVDSSPAFGVTSILRSRPAVRQRPFDVPHERVERQ